MSEDRAPFSSLGVVESRSPVLVAGAWIWMMVGLVGLSLIAAYFIEIDIVVRGAMVLAPPTESARLQAAETGVVHRIDVRDGETVERGQVLVALDVRDQRVRLRSLQRELGAANQRLSALKSRLNSRGEMLTLIDDQQSAQESKLDSEVAELRVELSLREAEVELRQHQKERVATLADREFIAAQEYQERLLRFKETEVEMLRTQARLTAKRAERRHARTSEKKQEYDVKLATIDDRLAIAKLRQDIARYRYQIEQTRLKIERSELLAPRDGVVQALSVHDPGDVVHTGDTLLRIVPSDGRLIGDVNIPAKSVGFVREGQPVRLKFDAYSHEDFGTGRGKVVRISPDARRPENSETRLPFYTVTVALTNRPKADDEPVALKPGMTGVAELVVRKERLLLAFLRPFRGRLDSLPQ